MASDPDNISGIVNPNGTSAWLALGGNSSYSYDSNRINIYNPKIPWPIDLGSLPTSFNATGWKTHDKDNQDDWPPLASVLLCDSNMNISSSKVQFTSQTNTLTVLSDTPTNPVGNISPDIASFIMAYGLAWPTFLYDNADGSDQSWGGPNGVLSRFFVQPSQINGSASYAVRPAADISSLMGSFMSSAGKSWSDGYNGSETLQTFDQEATSYVNKLALVGSIPLTALTGGLILLLIILSIPQIGIPRGESLQISSLEKVLTSVSR